MSTSDSDAPGEWWSWLKAGMGFTTPVLLMGLWTVYVAVNASQIATDQAADPEPAPDSGSAYYLFLMMMISVCFLAVFVLIGGVLCLFRSERAYGIGMLVGTTVPVLVVVGYWVSLSFIPFVSIGR